MARPIPALRDVEIAYFREKFVAGPVDACWLWEAHRDKSGYGKFNVHVPEIGDARPFLAHRVAWVVANGRDPGSLCVLHRCDNPACVNPAHLFLGTHRDNSDDKLSKSRQARGDRIAHRKLSDDDVRGIRRMLSTGSTPYAVSKHYPVSPGSILQIRDGRSYRYVV